MKKVPRIVFEVFGPPAIASVIFVGLFAMLGRLPLQLVLSIVMIAFAIALIPSAIYAFVMEFSFSRGLRPSSWRSVGLSSLLGALAGIPIGLVFPDSSGGPASYLIMIPLRAVVGCLTGIMVKFGFSKRRGPIQSVQTRTTSGPV